jgi:hypothetical protein
VGLTLLKTPLLLVLGKFAAELGFPRPTHTMNDKAFLFASLCLLIGEKKSS